MVTFLVLGAGQLSANVRAISTSVRRGALILGFISSAASAQSAPFGFNWGSPLSSFPQASEIEHTRNISVLLYRPDRLPADFRDIREVVLKVCDVEGLQQVHAVSGLLTGDDARAKFELAYNDGVRRYGRANGDPNEGRVSWDKAEMTMFAKLVKPGFYKITMVYDGPGFSSCISSFNRAGSEK